MNAKRMGTLFLVTVSLASAGVAVRARSTARTTRKAAAPAASQMSDEDRAALLTKGKEIFVEKCAKCHNDRGDKALSSGKPLNERGLATDAITRAVRGRLKDRTDEERQAVTLYIASLMKKD